jgi:hypothetical protein
MSGHLEPVAQGATEGLMRFTCGRLVVAASLCGVAAAGAQEKMPSADAVVRELKAGNDRHVAVAMGTCAH